MTNPLTMKLEQFTAFSAGDGAYLHLERTDAHDPRVSGQGRRSSVRMT